MEDRSQALANPIIRSWFSSFKPWNGEAASLSRLVWIKCRGMPLNIWCHNTFKRIGKNWGEFTALDEETIHGSSFEVGKMMIVTESPPKIDEWNNVCVKGKYYRVKENEMEVQSSDKGERETATLLLQGGSSKQVQSPRVDVAILDQIVEEGEDDFIENCIGHQKSNPDISDTPIGPVQDSYASSSTSNLEVVVGINEVSSFPSHGLDSLLDPFCATNDEDNNEENETPFDGPDLFQDDVIDDGPYLENPVQAAIKGYPKKEEILKAFSSVKRAMLILELRLSQNLVDAASADYPKECLYLRFWCLSKGMLGDHFGCCYFCGIFVKLSLCSCFPSLEYYFGLIAC
ncbi:hypothetical protein Vadar_016093 [Vaccinium darrowii]|uniref:Uncharacterized protein n=1 Tax=Vaccinium darrowii TaxID=229202 RepID=A0ACB7XHW2_9ERIC|nr:hypothetical protein Vadar_016093 [Vaccinium darrowii]